jgi:hypothetical protein
MALQYLYKYRTFNDASERIITSDEVYVPSPLEFNDPFDCRIPVIANGREEDFRTLLHDHLKWKIPNLPKWRLEQIVHEKLRDDTHRNPDLMKKELDYAITDRLSKTGVYCLSAVNDDILMWSHYADGHKGFCLEHEGGDEKTFLKRARKVRYQLKLPIVNYFDAILRDRTLLDTILLTKSEKWSYENEWRIIQVDGPGIYGIPEGILSGVIFGCQMSQEHKERIISWSKKRSNPIRFYQAQMKRHEFGLDILRI